MMDEVNNINEDDGDVYVDIHVGKKDKNAENFINFTKEPYAVIKLYGDDDYPMHKVILGGIFDNEVYYVPIPVYGYSSMFMSYEIDFVRYSLWNDWESFKMEVYDENPDFSQEIKDKIINCIPPSFDKLKVIQSDEHELYGFGDTPSEKILYNFMFDVRRGKIIS